MKTLFVSFAALLFAFFFGCQSSITDPIVSDNGNNFTSEYAENFVDKNLTPEYPGVIKLDGVLRNPLQPLNCIAVIEGEVRYRLENVYFDQTPPPHNLAIKVNMKVDAKIKCENAGYDSKWTVASVSEDLITKTPAVNVYYLEKAFKVNKIQGAPLDLVLKFKVTEESLSLVSKDLRVHIGGVPIGDPGF
jgi:hypothetical protein